MVRYALKVEAELNGVTSLEPVDDVESPFEYTFTIQCTNCREIHGKPVTINRFESHDMSGSRGEASFVFRCKVCKSEHSASISRTNELVSGDDDSSHLAVILTVDSRGMEFVEFHPQGEFRCVGNSGTRFGEIDLSEGEWYDYDDKAGEEVSVVDVKWSIDRI